MQLYRVMWSGWLWEDCGWRMVVGGWEVGADDTENHQFHERFVRVNAYKLSLSGVIGCGVRKKLICLDFGGKFL